MVRARAAKLGEDIDLGGAAATLNSRTQLCRGGHRDISSPPTSELARQDSGEVGHQLYDRWTGTRGAIRTSGIAIFAAMQDLTAAMAASGTTRQERPSRSWPSVESTGFPNGHIAVVSGEEPKSSPGVVCHRRFHRASNAHSPRHTASTRSTIPGFTSSLTRANQWRPTRHTTVRTGSDVGTTTADGSEK